MSETVTGVCNEISERSGWQTFHIDKGTQYPVKLSTKKQEVIDAARAVGQQVATWTYNEVVSDKINEHTGQPFVNRYLEGVETGGTVVHSATITAPGNTTPAAGGNAPSRNGGSTPDETRGSIERQTIVKAAIGLYPVELKTDAEFFGLLLRLEAFCAGKMAAPEAEDDDSGIPF